jgi:adenylate cyclase
MLSYQDLLSLVESGKELAGRVELVPLLNDILQRARELTGSDGASILLQDERAEGLYFAAALGEGASTILSDYGELSPKRVPIQSKAGTVLLSGQSIVEESLEGDHDHFKGVDQRTGGVTKRMVCAAMSVIDSGSPKRLGVLQIINKKSGPYTERDRVLLEHFAAQAAIAIRNTTMLSHLVAHMGFYATRNPLEVIEELKSPPTSEPLTLMFADMRGFTRLCQTIRSEKKICGVLSEFMSMLGDEVLAHDGMVNKKLGDGILALFRRANGSRRAVQCAFSILNRFDELHRKWAASTAERIDFLDVGMGIVTDEVMLGTIGSGSMRDFTAIGTPVILASAIEKQARGGKRILSDRPTYFAVRDMVSEQVKPITFPLNKPDQPMFTSYDVYQLVARQTTVHNRGAGAFAKAFLCHASEDSERVRDLYDRLKTDGVNPWLDKVDLQAGEEWSVAIPNAVRACDVVLVCISSRTIGKEGYLQKEIRHALDVADEKPEGVVYVIPVRLEDCEIPQRLRRWQRVDLFQAEGYGKLIRALQAAVSVPEQHRSGS